MSKFELPPMATWLVYTDGVPTPHSSARLRWTGAFIVPVEALVRSRVLEKICGKKLA